MERLQKIIAQSGFCSRRKAEELITEGRVKVNGKVVTQLSFDVSDNDLVEFNNKVIKPQSKSLRVSWDSQARAGEVRCESATTAITVF